MYSLLVVKGIVRNVLIKLAEVVELARIVEPADCAELVKLVELTEQRS